MANTLFAFVMLAVFALAAGGLYLIIKRNNRKQGGLMLLAAFIFFANVLIWTIPTKTEVASPTP